MLRALLLSLTLITGLAQASTTRQLPISLDTDQGTLYGSLLLPQSDKPVPVALLIAGSGPTDRDGNNPEGGHNDALKKLAQVLARNGIASLRYDKRGVAASRGEARAGQRNLPGAGHAHHVDRSLGDAVVGERLARAGDEGVGDLGIPAAGDDRVTRAGRGAQVAFDVAHGHGRFAQGRSV